MPEHTLAKGKGKFRPAATVFQAGGESGLARREARAGRATGAGGAIVCPPAQ